LIAPIICSQGYYRIQDGMNNTAWILEETKYLDFLSPSKTIYSEFRSFKEARDGNISSINVPISYYEGNTVCLMCPPGYFCPIGSVIPKKCKPGTKCENSDYKETPCTQGTYNEKWAQYKCKLCDVGRICPFEGATSTEPCPPGFYCDEEGVGTTNQEYKLKVFKIAKK